MENHKTWLLIADASQAKIYSLRKARLFTSNDPKELQLLSQYTHDDSRKKGIDLNTDRMGEFGHGGFDDQTPPKLREAEHFAYELLHHIETGIKENHFRDLVIIAPPHFMGLLNKYMSHSVQKLVSQTIEKDYTRQTGKELMDSLIAHF